jgi:GNAT superfamily N-acetyltransferase
MSQVMDRSAVRITMGTLLFRVATGLVGQRGPVLLVHALDLCAPVRRVAGDDRVTFAPLPSGMDTAWGHVAPDDECFGGYADGECVAQFRVRPLTTEARDAAMLRCLADGRACLFHAAETAPGWRGRGVMPAAMQWLAARRRERGERWMVAETRADSPAACRAVAKAGFRLVGRSRVRS